MYNRYIRNDNGQYERVPVNNTPPPYEPHGPNQDGYIPNVTPPSSIHREQEKRGFLSSLLGRLKLDEIDTGDLLLLVILFLLFKDGEDEELLIALGLLLIL